MSKTRRPSASKKRPQTAADIRAGGSSPGHGAKSEIIRERTAPPAVRLGAARTVAELAMHQHEAEAVVLRLDEIERHQREQVDANQGCRQEDRHARIA
jgi:hypothetical protein